MEGRTHMVINDCLFVVLCVCGLFWMKKVLKYEREAGEREGMTACLLGQSLACRCGRESSPPPQLQRIILQYHTPCSDQVLQY